MEFEVKIVRTIEVESIVEIKAISVEEAEEMAETYYRYDGILEQVDSCACEISDEVTEVKILDVIEEE